VESKNKNFICCNDTRREYMGSLKKISKGYFKGKVFIVFIMLIVYKNFLFHYFTSVDLNRTNSLTNLGIFIVFLSISEFLSKRKKVIYLYSFNILFSIIFFANTLYFSYFGSPITSFTFLQINNMNGLGESILSTIKVKYFLFFVDLLVIPLYFRFFHRLSEKDMYKVNTKKGVIYILIIIGILFTCYYPSRMYAYNKDILKPRFDSVDLIRNFGLLAYQTVDVYSFLNERKALNLSQKEKDEIKRWFNKKNIDNIAVSIDSNSGSLKGIGEKKNLILIQVESLQNFVVNKRFDGQEITPNINKMLGNSVYFPNLYPQTVEGNSSDAEFLSQTSLYPISKGSVYFRYSQNSYNSLAKILKKDGYSNLAVHADEATFWNRNEMYPSLGFDTYKSITNFKVDDEIGMGLSDMSMFKQSISMLKEKKSPFYAFYITLTNHVPFDLPSNYRKLDLPSKLDESIIGNYLQSVNYTDRAIGNFIADLEKNDLLNNSIVVLYGDHDGIFKKDRQLIEKLWSNESISDEKWLREYTPVPFLIYNPEIKGSINQVIGGQIDILPTIEYIMGRSSNLSMYSMGKNLFMNTEGEAILPKGDYSSEPFYITNKEIYGELTKEQKDVLETSDLFIRSNYFKSIIGVK
jgi:lipoteichoic acid synthase